MFTTPMDDQVRCTKCGAYNQPNASSCKLCGHPIHRPDRDSQRCPECGYDNRSAEAEKCIACGRSLTTLKAAVAEIQSSKPEECEHWSEKPTHAVRTAKAVIGGILILLAGAMGITHALLSVLPGTGEDVLFHYEQIIPQGEFLDGVLEDYVLVAALMFIFGALAIMMSLFAFMRSRYYGAIAGAVFGIVSIGFLIGAFIALVGLVLVATSKREFIPECD